MSVALAFFLLAFPSVKLQEVAAQLQTECRCQVGVAAGPIEEEARTFHFGERRYPTASTYKLPIAIAFLKSVDSGRFTLDQKIHVLPVDITRGVSRIAEEMPRGGEVQAGRLVSLMIAESDNSASDAILRTAGGAAAVDALLAVSGINGIRVAGPERDMNTCADPPLNSTTPSAMVRLLAALYQGKLLKPATSAFLIRTLEQTKTFPGRIKGLLPPGTVVAHKTGTGDCAVNDVGVITLPGGREHLAIAVYLRGSRLSAVQNDAIIARMSKAAYQAFLTLRDADFPSEPNTMIFPGAQAMLRDDAVNGETVVPEGKYFVLGDNRDLSLDSRYWGFVDRSEIFGNPLSETR